MSLAFLQNLAVRASGSTAATLWAIFRTIGASTLYSQAFFGPTSGHSYAEGQFDVACLLFTFHHKLALLSDDSQGAILGQPEGESEGVLEAQGVVVGLPSFSVAFGGFYEAEHETAPKLDLQRAVVFFEVRRGDAGFDCPGVAGELLEGGEDPSGGHAEGQSGYELVHGKYYSLMGHSNSKEQLLTVHTEKNQSVHSQTFDFTKPKVVMSTQKLVFPSYLVYNQSLNQIVYTAINSNPNEFAIYNRLQTYHEEVFFVKNHHSLFNMWQLIEPGVSVELKEGQKIRIGRAELEVRQIRTCLADVKEDQVLTADALGPDSIVRSSVWVDENVANMGESKFSRVLASRMSNMVESRYVPDKGSMSRQSLFVSMQQRQCRFCFESSEDRQNPLLNICECAGSVAHIHYRCLQSWISSKSKRTETSHCIYYNYEPLRCQICKAYLRNEVEVGGRKYVLRANQQMHPPYLRLSYQNEGKILEIVVRLEENIRLTVGRGSDNDVQIKDKSVSRPHCSLYYGNHRLFLQANQSKFGTFMAPTSTLQLTPEAPIKLLLHNTIVVVKRKEKEKSGWGECCAEEETCSVVIKRF